MKKIISVLLVIMLLISNLSVTCAVGLPCNLCSGPSGELCSQCYGTTLCSYCGHCMTCEEYGVCNCISCALNIAPSSHGTQVTYDAQNDEQYTITIPALLKPEQTGNVTLTGTWPTNRMVVVTSDETVSLKNSILPSDTKILDVYFDGISASGNNTEAITATEPVSVSGIQNALFGVWSGTFYYNVELQTIGAPYSIRFYQPYVTKLDDGTIIEYVFHEDGALDIYTVRNDYAYGEVYGPNSVLFYENKISFDGLDMFISEDGTTLENNGVTATLTPTPIKALRKDTNYEFQYETWTLVAQLRSNNSLLHIEYKDGIEQGRHESEPNSIIYNKEYFIEKYYDSEYNETYIYRYAIYPDGSKIIIGNGIYYLQCEHQNTEIKFETEEYTGDKYCSDCGQLLEKGMNRNGEAYALILNNENDANEQYPMVFARVKERIQPGDTFHTTEFGDKEVLYAYTGFETEIYNGEYMDDWLASSNVPWVDEASMVTSVVFEDQITPLETTFWFAWFSNCDDFDLAKLNTSQVTSMENMFYDAGITDASSLLIGDDVLTIKHMFKNCENLTVAPVLTTATYLKDLEGAFESTNIITAPELPQHIENLNATFRYCYNLITPCDIISDATVNLNHAFWGCEQIRGDMTINANIEGRYSGGSIAFRSAADEALTIYTNDISVVTWASESDNLRIIVTLETDQNSIEPNFVGSQGINHQNAGAYTIVHIPEGVEIIEYSSFFFMLGLKEVYLPSTLKEIGSGAFKLFTGDFYYPGTTNEWAQIKTDTLWCGQYSSLEQLNHALATAVCSTVHCDDGEVIIHPSDIGPQ